MDAERRVSVRDGADLVEIDRVLSAGDRVEELDLPFERSVWFGPP